MLTSYKHSILFAGSDSDIEKKFYNIDYRCNVTKAFFSSLTLPTNRPEHLFLVAPQAMSFAGKTRAIPIGATSKIISYPYSLYLTTLTSYKRSILFGGSNSDIEKKFYNIDYRCNVTEAFFPH
jgi:hypothetical protein